ncbi:Vmc-like lipoprotein signal peptide domain-containing protein [Mycoplasma anserisalpingitidis]|uniref:Vmc-like lipoprotein signal peptide domain-containing protein n=1 Tax=Mycoplasma anserisalpingitidis TaxID=519450 RepID=UPI001CF6C894|nr:hypothetical protein [Mycoplasma anserisalpingitidis]UCU27420.1 hypothetical protein K9O38_00005 [Mycoplasma anserisalpingitidis]
MKKKLFFGLAVAPSVLIAPVVVSCTDKEEEKTKEIDKQNIEKFSSLIKDLTPTLGSLKIPMKIYQVKWWTQSHKVLTNKLNSW